MSQKFKLGQLVSTPGVLKLVAELRDPTLLKRLLDRHSVGDWGDLDFEDKEANDQGLLHSDRLLSSYKVGEKFDRIWIITERDRSVTTFLLPEEY